MATLREFSFTRHYSLASSFLTQKHDFNLEESIKAVGILGKYQIKNLVILKFIWVIIPTITILMPYLRITPVYTCGGSSPNNPSRLCSKEEMCGNNNSNLNRRVDYSQSVKNWASDFDLVCDKHIYYGYFSSLYFLGVIFGTFGISEFTERFGRKPIIQIYLGIYILLGVIMILTPSYLVLFPIQFITGVLYSGITLSAFVLNLETSSKDYRPLFSTILNSSYSEGAIINILLFIIFENWKINLLFVMFISVIILFNMKDVMESPAYLQMRNEYDKLYEVLKFISIKNEKFEAFKRYIKQSDFNRTNPEESNSNKPDVHGIPYCLKNNFRKLSLLGTNWFIMSFIFYGINFNMLKFKGNIYLNGIIIYLSEVISTYSSNVLSKYSNLKNTILLFFFISGVSLSILSAIGNDSFITNILLLFLAKFGVSGVNNLNYIFTSTAFDTNTRVGSLSFCSLMARLGGMSTSIIIELIDDFYFLFAFLAFVAIVTFFFYKEDLEEEDRVSMIKL